MDIEEQIKILCVKEKISLAELARRIGTSPQNLGQKAKKGRVTVEEMHKMAEAVGCVYDGHFILANGDKV